MAWSLLEDQLTTTVGEEKGKTVAKKWNDIADELENTKKKGKTPQGAAYSKAYFLTRLQTEAGLSKAQTEAIGRMLSVLDGTQGKDVSATSAEEYNVPKLPCRCLL
ncbi:MAG: hypothetical protein JSS66_04800 [Armatimonadetes bacterium]|nr:hypothetical protein [Armatimonadota bacterium]